MESPQPKESLEACLALIDLVFRQLKHCMIDIQVSKFEGPVQALLPRLEVSVCRYFFSIYGESLWLKYHHKNAEANARFLTAKSRVADWEDSKLLEELEASDRGSSSDAPMSVVRTTCSSTEVLLLTRQRRNSIVNEILVECTNSVSGGSKTRIPCHRQPYFQVSHRISLLEEKSPLFGFTPLDTLDDLIAIISLLKTRVLEDNDREVVTMDEVFPIFVFCLIRSRLSSPFTLWNVLYDSLSDHQRLDSEGRYISILEQAALAVSDFM